MRKKVISMIIVLCMIMTLLPAMGLAAEDTAYAVTGGNIYFDKLTGAIVDADEDITAAVIPGEIDGTAVTAIGDGAFNGCGNLQSVTLPWGVKSIGTSAFNSCENLAAVTLPESLETIG
ncbi:MAG: leucine-rich repeat domain-containing protein, partial [Clostridia bacterium]|nr:leucine-rich repeat domain-containing protein [Clostridia bacterium]